MYPPSEPFAAKEEEGTYFARGQRNARPGDRRVGVVWHTQGSGKSLTMAFYAGRVVLHPAMENPTLVIITDRNDLDDQLFGTFARCHELLRQQPEQAQSRAHLRELLHTGSGGVVFTTVQKFFPACAGRSAAGWIAGDPKERLVILPAAQEHVLKQEDGKNRLARAVSELSKAFALAVPHEKALEIRDDVAFFQAVKSVLTKSAGGDRKSPEEIDHAIRQIVSKAVASDEVIDIFAAAGLKKPDISILSDEFLAEVRGLPQRNLAVEMLRKLLEGEIKTRGRKNIVQARSFSEMLENSIRRYQNRAIETALVIEELIASFPEYYNHHRYHGAIRYLTPPPTEASGRGSAHASRPTTAKEAGQAATIRAPSTIRLPTLLEGGLKNSLHLPSLLS